MFITRMSSALLVVAARAQNFFLFMSSWPTAALMNSYLGERRGSLYWNQRYDIILNIARGLAYLHEDSHVCIIYGDIKPSNILLDDDFQPKIADFELDRLFRSSICCLGNDCAGTWLGNYTRMAYTWS